MISKSGVKRDTNLCPVIISFRVFQIPVSCIIGIREVNIIYHSITVEIAVKTLCWFIVEPIRVKYFYKHTEFFVILVHVYVIAPDHLNIRFSISIQVSHAQKTVPRYVEICVVDGIRHLTLLMAGVSYEHKLSSSFSQKVPHKKLVGLQGSAKLLNQCVYIHVIDFKCVFLCIVIIIHITETIPAVPVIIHSKHRIRCSNVPGITCWLVSPVAISFFYFPLAYAIVVVRQQQVWNVVTIVIQKVLSTV